MASREGKTEAPTQKRKDDARKKGTIAKSADLSPWLGLLAGSYLLPYTIGAIAESSAAALARLRGLDPGADTGTVIDILTTTLTSGFLAIAPLLLVCGGVGLLAQLAQTGLLITGKPLKPDFKRISPMQGVKRLFSVRSAWDTVKQTAKAVLIGVLTWPSIRGMADDLTAHGRVPLLKGLASVGSHLLGMIRVVSWTVVALAVADYLFQRRQRLRDLRMSRQDVRDEYRNAEGDPHVKQRIRSLQAATARRRMMADVGTASVVITNPTHFAVAVRYDPVAGGAPRIVASGADELAGRIREKAADAGVPVVEAPPLARALWRTCQVGDEIPATLYEAVAKVLVFIRRLRGGVLAATSLPLPAGYQVDPSGLEALTRRRGRRAA